MKKKTRGPLTRLLNSRTTTVFGAVFRVVDSINGRVYREANALRAGIKYGDISVVTLSWRGAKPKAKIKLIADLLKERANDAKVTLRDNTITIAWAANVKGRSK